MGEIGRVVALGASNLTLGLRSVVSASRAAWGPKVEILAALGHGRSYGAQSRLILRTLPGILESGLWPALESMPHLPTRAVITDVGNDILYGFSAERTLAWVEEALGRLRSVADDITVTGLPLVSVRGLGRARYLFLRSILFPGCRLSLAQVLESAEAVNSGLAALAIAQGVRFLRMDPAWYGFDPIHIRRSSRRSAWRAILDVPAGSPDGGSSLREALRLSLMAPERRRILGVERFTRQSGAVLPSGGRVWLF